jgi:hypothetical protein
MDTENGGFYDDSFSQWAISMERLFSGSALSDREFDEVGEVLFRMERDFTLRVIKLLAT